MAEGQISDEEEWFAVAISDVRNFSDRVRLRMLFNELLERRTALTQARTREAELVKGLTRITAIVEDPGEADDATRLDNIAEIVLADQSLTNSKETKE